MSERRGLLVPARRSIFVKLVAIMAAMAFGIVLLVAGFFVHVVTPKVDVAMERVLTAYAEQLAGQSLDRETADQLAQRLDLTISYDGPRGSWTVAPVGGARPSAVAPTQQHARHLVEAPDGGSYAFSWNVGMPLKAAHDRLLLLLLLLIVGVLVAGHEVLRRSLRPLRLLIAGVERFGSGALEAEVPRRSQDELGALTDTFNQMARRVKEMLDLREQLLLDVSHELRSPLTRMKVALALMPEEDESRRRIAADVAQMETMVSSILELGRLSDARGLHIEHLDLVAMVNEVGAQFREIPPGLQTTLPQKPLFLNADAERLRTLLRNLLENATKYSLAESPPTELTLEADSDVVVMTIRDHGQGVSEQDLGVIFEPFRRVDPSRSKRTGGVGLGLSICRRIVAAHGGEIRAEPSPAGGLTIVATLGRRVGAGASDQR